MDDWKQQTLDRINKLKKDKDHIRELDSRLAYQELVAPHERECFYLVMQIINEEIERLKFELILDEMLSSDLSLEEFMEKYKNH